MRELRGRFAPSPSGRMHLGNLFSGLLAWLSVRSAGGTMVLRMEDLDPDRCREEYALQLADDLRWLGLDWDEGYGAGGPHGPYRQSGRTDYYAACFRTLAERGLVYPCYCTRAERLAASAPHASDGAVVYSGRCAHLTAQQRQDLEAQGRRPAFRVRVPREEITIEDGHMGPYTQQLDRDCGDFIVRRSDGVWAYQLAVVVDDALMGVSHVVRGCDLLSSSPAQAWLHRTLGYEPPQFYHLPLLVDAQGRRLSKRDRDLDMGVLREKYTPQELVGWLGWLAGLQDTPKSATPDQLISRFHWSKVPKTSIVVGST